jgi:hypothetical protein
MAKSEIESRGSRVREGGEVGLSRLENSLGAGPSVAQNPRQTKAVSPQAVQKARMAAFLGPAAA